MAISKILAIYTDGVVTHGAVLRKKKGGVEEIARAESRAPAPVDIIADLKEKLKGQARVPKQAILGTDRAVLHLGDLPVDPARPRPYEQMRELARWETEPLFSDLPNWTVRDVLFQSGRITPEQDRLIMEEVDGLGGPHQARYQDVAVSMKLLARNVRDAALDQQERLSAVVSDAACGWTPAHGAASEDGAQHRWLLSALSAESRREWLEAFKTHKIKLEEIAPGWGGSLSAAAIGGDGLILERHSGAICIIRLSNRGVESLRSIDLVRPGANELDALQRVLEGREADHVLAIGFEGEALEEIRAIEPETQFEADWPAAALRGLAARLILKDAAQTPAVRLIEPSPPFYKNPDLARVALVVFALLGVGGNYLYSEYKLSNLQSRLAKLDAEYDEKRSLTQQINSMVSHISGLKRDIASAETVLADARGQEEIAAYLQDRRPELVGGMLDALIGAVHSGVVLRSIEESKTLREVFIVSAWAIDEVGAEEFNAALNRNLAAIGLSVADESVSRGRGVQGIEGTNINLRIAPIGESQRAEASE